MNGAAGFAVPPKNGWGTVCCGKAEAVLGPATGVANEAGFGTTAGTAAEVLAVTGHFLRNKAKHNGVNTKLKMKPIYRNCSLRREAKRVITVL